MWPLKLTKWILIFVSVVGLAAVRLFQEELFYDPFIGYFKSNYLGKKFPEYESLKLLISHIFRFSLNGILSIAILILLFGKEFLKSILMVYVFFMVLFLGLYFWQVECKFCLGNMPVFYIRRFLIQPLLLLLMIPGIWIWKNNQKNRN